MTARDEGRAAAQAMLRTDPLSEDSINLIADAVMNAYAPGHRAEVLREVRRTVLAASLAGPTDAASAANAVWTSGYRAGLSVAAGITTPPVPAAGQDDTSTAAAERCDVKFVDGSQCSKSAGHRTVKNQDLHTPDSESAVLAFLHTPALAALLTDDDQRRQLLDIRDLIGDDDLARAWLIGMNPDLGDESPLGAIADGRGADAMAAAREFIQ